MANNVVIKVTPAELRTVATKIRSQAEDYAKQYISGCGFTIPYSSQGMAYGKQQAGHNDGAKN